MKKISTYLVTMLLCLSSFNLYAATKDDLDCRKLVSPMFTPVPGYRVCGCEQRATGSRDVAIENGNIPGIIRMRGTPVRVSYCPQDERASRYGARRILRSLGNDIEKQGGVFIGKTVKTPRIDVYRQIRDGKAIWMEVWVENNGNYNYIVTQ